MQYNTTLQLADTFYNSSQTGEDMEKVDNLIVEVGYILSVQATFKTTYHFLNCYESLQSQYLLLKCTAY